jgi:hypothetical protein
MLTPEEEIPGLHPNFLLNPKHGDQVATIEPSYRGGGGRGGVYALWELPRNDYVLQALFEYDFRRLQFMTLIGGPAGHHKAAEGIAHVHISCRPGNVMFFAVRERGFFSAVTLDEMSREDAMPEVLGGLRSVGVIVPTSPFYVSCPSGVAVSQ